MKKVGLFLLGLIAVFVFTSMLVTAQPQWLTDMVSTTGIENFNIFEQSAFVQILLFFLVFLFVYAVSGEIPFVGEKKWVAFVVS